MANSSFSLTTNQEVLQRRWQERCRSGKFSPAVLGLGTIRVFGRSGDAPVNYPRIEQITQRDALEEDERWALQVAQDLITAAQQQQRTVLEAAVASAQGIPPQSAPVRVFDPKSEQILILSLTRGG